MVPPMRTAPTAVVMASGAPEVSKTTSTPRPFVISMIASTTSVELESITASAPRRPAASARAPGRRTLTAVNAESKAWAQSRVVRPIGPAPMTSAVWPAPKLPLRMPCQPTVIGSTSAPISNGTESGIACTV